MIVIYNKKDFSFKAYKDINVASEVSGIREDRLKFIEGTINIGDMVVGELEIVKSARGGKRAGGFGR